MSVIARASTEALFENLPEGSLKAISKQIASPYGPIILRACRAGRTRLGRDESGIDLKLVETPTGGVVLRSIAEDGATFVRRLPFGWTKKQFVRAFDTLYHKAFVRNREVFLVNNPDYVVE